MARDYVYCRGAATLELHGHDVDAGHDPEQLAREMLEGAYACHGIVQLAGLLPGERDEFFYRLGWKPRKNGEHIRPSAENSDRGKGLDRIEREFVERRVE